MGEHHVLAVEGVVVVIVAAGGEVHPAVGHGEYAVFLVTGGEGGDHSANLGLVFVEHGLGGDVDRGAVVLGGVRRGVTVSGGEVAAVGGREAHRGQCGAGINGVHPRLGQGHVLAVKGVVPVTVSAGGEINPAVAHSERAVFFVTGSEGGDHSANLGVIFVESARSSHSNCRRSIWLRSRFWFISFCCFGIRRTTKINKLPFSKSS